MRERRAASHGLEHRAPLRLRSGTAFAAIRPGAVLAGREAVVDAEVTEDVEVRFGLDHERTARPQAETTSGAFDHGLAKPLDEIGVDALLDRPQREVLFEATPAGLGLSDVRHSATIQHVVMRRGAASSRDVAASRQPCQTDCVTRAAREILQEMLELPEGERLDVVTEVLARLQGEPDPDWEAAWLAELDRREFTDTAEPTVDEEWPAVRARILNAVSGRGR
jgi:hypothetical protein